MIYVAVIVGFFLLLVVKLGGNVCDRRSVKHMKKHWMERKEIEMEDEKYLVTIKEAAAMTAMSLGWWRLALRSGSLPATVRVVRIGRAVRLHAADIKKWVEGEAPSAAPHRGPGRPRKTK